MPDDATMLRVGTAYRQRRESLGMSMAELREHGAPSERLVSEFERGIRWPARRLHAGLCQAVGWSSDSLDRLAQGEMPTEATAPQSTEAALRLVLEELARLRQAVEDLRSERG